MLIAKSAGQELKEDVLEACLKANQDGFGAAWFDGTKVRKTRGLHGIKKILEVEKAIRDYKAIIHFRWTTHGRTCNENCHPFVVGRGQGAFAHNGIFTSAKSFKDWSDTRVIAHYFNQCSEAAIIKNLEKFNNWHGYGNRTAFLLSDGNIYRTGTWQEHDGVQFSNLNWKHSGRMYDYDSCDYDWVGRGNWTGNADTYRLKKPKKWQKYFNGQPVYDEQDENEQYMPHTEHASSYSPKKTDSEYATLSAQYVETSSGLVALTDSAKSATSSTENRSGGNGQNTAQSSQTPKVRIEVFGKPDKRGRHHFIVLVDNGRGVKKGTVQHGILKETVSGWKKCGREVEISYCDEQTRYQQWLFEHQQEQALATCC